MMHKYQNLVLKKILLRVETFTKLEGGLFYFNSFYESKNTIFFKFSFQLFSKYFIVIQNA